MKKRILIDFDGVIHSYERGWQNGEIYGTPTTGVDSALATLALSYEVVVFTSRTDLEPVQAWCTKWGLDKHITLYTNNKLPSEFIIDDRAVRHVNWHNTMKFIAEAGA